MTKLRAQLRRAVQAGIDGWLAACFSGAFAPIDSLTDYPLIPETARIYYHSSMPYRAIEDAYIEQMGVVQALNDEQLQMWINYHWQYARVELAEDFSAVPPMPITADMEARREQMRQSLYARGYQLKGTP